jgi:C-terminal processing protease CtpA/Prc
MREIKDTRALIIDLRDNGGGGSDIGPVLESCFIPAGRPLLEFKGREGAVRTDSTIDWLNGKRYDQPVYIIVNKKTASAAEAFAFVMQQNKRATIAGERSAGASYMNELFAVDDNSYVSVSTAAPTLPGRKSTWEKKGISPDIRIKSNDPVPEIVGRITKN